MADLLRDGILAARTGDKATARAKLREVVAVDQANEQGWLWLASVAETIEERRICLGKVITINPNNERAKEFLSRATFDNPHLREEYTVITADRPKGPSRLLLLLGALVALVALVVIFLLPRGADQSTLPTGAGIGLLATSGNASMTTAVTPPQTASQVETPDAGQTATSQAIETRRAQFFPTMPPSWTPRSIPTVQSTSTATVVVLASPPPAALTGRLVILRGRSQTRTQALPFFLYDLRDGSIRAIAGSDRGNYGILSPDGRHLIYSAIVTATREQFLIRITILNSGARPEELSSRWGGKPPLADQWMPAISRDGQLLIFSARNTVGENERTTALFSLPVNFGPASPTPTLTGTPLVMLTSSPTDNVPPDAAVPPTATITPSPTRTVTLVPVQATRLTHKDDGFNVWPDLSPDGQFIVYGREERSGDTVFSADLLIMPSAGGEARFLTNDGPAVIESAPRWSPDGRQIVYEAQREGQSERTLFIIEADGSSPRPLEMQSAGDNQRPCWSPDGKWVAFASNRTGKYEVFVVEVQTGQTYQLTSSAEPTYVTDWAP